MPSTKKRLCYLDLLRIIACFLVILNHTEGYINCLTFKGDTFSFSLLLHLFVGMLVKIHVPTFWMITGTLLLNRDITIISSLKKSLRISVILLVFSIVANVAYKGYLYVPGFIRAFASADVDGAGPYWYLYAYIGVLLMAPFLRSIACHLEMKHVNYLIFLRICITGVIPMIFLFLNKQMDTNIHLAEEFNPALAVADCIFYPLIGYGIDRKLNIDRIKTAKIIGIFSLFLGANILECILTWYAGPNNVYSGFDFLMAISFFILIKYQLSAKTIPAGIEKAICLIGPLTFGIYLLDPIIGDFLKENVHSLYPAIPSLLLVSLLYALISFVIGGLITYLWSFCLRILYRRHNEIRT